MPPTTTRPKKSVLRRVVNRVRSVPLGQISLSMLKQAKTLSTKLPKRIPAEILEKYMPTTTTRPKKSVLHRVVNRVRSVPLGQISLSMLKQAKTLSTKLPKRIPAGILEKARALAGRSAPAAMFALTVALLLIAWKARAARKKKRAMRNIYNEFMPNPNLTENNTRKMGQRIAGHF